MHLVDQPIFRTKPPGLQQKSRSQNSTNVSRRRFSGCSQNVPKSFVRHYHVGSSKIDRERTTLTAHTFPIHLIKDKCGQHQRSATVIGPSCRQPMTDQPKSCQRNGGLTTRRAVRQVRVQRLMRRSCRMNTEVRTDLY